VHRCTPALRSEARNAANYFRLGFKLVVKGTPGKSPSKIQISAGALKPPPTPPLPDSNWLICKKPKTPGRSQIPSTRRKRQRFSTRSDRFCPISPEVVGLDALRSAFPVRTRVGGGSALCITMCLGSTRSGTKIDNAPTESD